MICVVVLQNWMGYADGETGSYSETCVTFGVDGSEGVSIEVEKAVDTKEEISIKVEETINIKDAIPEFVSVPSIKTEPAVRLCGVCVVVAAHAFRPFIAPNRKL